jgi:hypothetical protein
LGPEEQGLAPGVEGFTLGPEGPDPGEETSEKENEAKTMIFYLNDQKFGLFLFDS